jgi:hypothetical protein
MNRMFSQVCRALASVSRDESLWRSLGHPSWEKDHASTYRFHCGWARARPLVVLTALACDGLTVDCRETGWKGAYMAWLRAVSRPYVRVHFRYRPLLVPLSRTTAHAHACSRNKTNTRCVLVATPDKNYSCTIRLLVVGPRHPHHHLLLKAIIVCTSPRRDD